MSKIKKYHTSKFKFKVALTAIKGNNTVGELCQEFGLVSSQIYGWKKQLEESGSNIFLDKRKEGNKDESVEKLHATIGKLLVERDFLSNALSKLN